MARIPKHRLIAAALFAVLLLVPAAASAIGWYEEITNPATDASSSDSSEGGFFISALASVGISVAGVDVADQAIPVAQRLPQAVDAPVTPGDHSSSHAIDSSYFTESDLVNARAGLDLDYDDSKAVQSGPTTSSAAVADAGVVPAETVAWAAVAALGAAGALAWFWPHLKKLVGLAAVAPLYARITRQEVFENAVRERIFTLVKGDPGISASDLSARAKVSWGTTMYHLEVLEQNRMVASMKQGRYRRYFINGAELSGTKEEVAILKNTKTAAVADVLTKAPGLTQKEISRATDMSPQALHWHMGRLVDAGLVRKEREGRVVRHYPAETVAA